MTRRTWPSWLKSYLTRYGRSVALALFLGIVAAGCSALLMFTSGYLISKTAVAATTLFSIMIPVGFVQLFGIGRPLARYLERLKSHDWVLRITSDLRVALFRSVERRTGDPALARATGEYLGLLADDVAHLQNLYLRVVFPTVIAYVTAIGASALFGFFSLPFAAIVLLAMAVVVVLVPLCSFLATRALSERAKALKAAEFVQLADDVNGAVDWMLSGRSGAAMERHSLADGDIRAVERKLRMTQRSLSLISTLLLIALLVGVVAWAGATFDAPGADINWVAAFALGFFPIIDSFAMLPAAFSESTTHRDSVERLDEYLREPLDGEPGFPAGKVGRTITPAGSGDGEGGPLKPAFDLGATTTLELDDVTYAYPGAKRPALDGVTLSFARGTATAILGRSGAGKSTLAQLARGALAPTAGQVRVLGVTLQGAGADLSDIVGFLGQTPYLFNRTLRDNLTLGVREATDERLAEVLASVGLGGKLAELERDHDGLDTVIGETGVGFSGGEAHRIALARVLVADTPIVIVDEPFSALDVETGRELLDTLLDVCAERTLVVITHHLDGIDRFDRVVFIEDARVDLDGSPAELAATSERFRTLVEFDR